MKKILVISLMCIGLSSCALFVPVWECVNEPYPPTSYTYYYYCGNYHRTPPSHNPQQFRTCQTHRSRPTYTSRPSRPPHRPSGRPGGSRPSGRGRGGRR